MTEILPRFDFRVDVAVAEDIGRVRQRFEDAHACALDAALFIVADGIGGHAGGEVAARIAVDAAEQSFRSERTQAILDSYAANPSLQSRRAVLARLRRAVEYAHEAVQQAAVEKPELTGMGTTLDVACLLLNKVFVAHVGDGRVYLARSQTTLQLTQDHTDFALLKARGQIRAAARAGAGQRLASAVGLGAAPNPDLLCIEVRRGDRLHLCTDGVHGQLDSEAKLTALLRSGSAETAAQALVDAVKNPGRDNATALVIDIGEDFVKRPAKDPGFSLEDFKTLQSSSLLHGLADAGLLLVLTAAVELDQEVGTTVGQAVASDMVAYIVLDGLLQLPDGRSVSTGATLFPESLVGVAASGLPVVKQAARLLRIRKDDFGEVCEADPQLGVELYRRLALHLARSLAV